MLGNCAIKGYAGCITRRGLRWLPMALGSARACAPCPSVLVFPLTPECGSTAIYAERPVFIQSRLPNSQILL